MSSSLISIGSSALGAAQAGLLTAGNNIANANTPGYSRQRIQQSDSPSLYTGSGYMGQGVQVETVQRQYDALLAQETRSAQSQASYSQTYSTQLGSIDNLLADPANGIPAALDSVFTGVAAVAANPSDPSARQTLLSSAQSLTGQLQDMSAQLSSMRATANTSITASVTQINAIAGQIAKLNQQIAVASQGAQVPNDLLDQRDTLLNNLSQQVNNSVVVDSGGNCNVFLGNGQALVLGQQAQTLVAQPDPQDPANVQVGLKTGGSVIAYGANSITGGTLGGLLAFRDQTLGDAQNAVGRVAIALGTAFNAQQSLGLDANGAPGAPMFSVGSPVVLTQSAAHLTATITDASALTTSDYSLKFDGTNYTLTRKSDGNQTTFTTFPQTVDGVTYDMNPPVPAPAANDSFLVEPTRNGAASLSMLISDPATVAAAAPVRTSASLSNTGTGQVSAGSVTAAYPATPLAAAQTLTFAGATGTLSGFPAGSPVTVTAGGVSTTYAAGAPVPYTAGASISWNGIQVQISGAPADGDTFTVAPNTGAAGDNRNALALGALQTTPLLGGSTIQQAFTFLTSTVGNKASQMQNASTAQASLLTQAQSAADSVSGVNLDEEASDLLRYQQAYQAAGKMLGIASTLFNTILSLGQ